MLKINTQNTNAITQIHIHDAEIVNIVCDYCKQSVNLDIKFDESKNNIKASLKFENVKYLSVSILEPWGGGIYIIEMNASKCPPVFDSLPVKSADGCFLTTFIINSGDIIKCAAEALYYNEFNI